MISLIAILGIYSLASAQEDVVPVTTNNEGTPEKVQERVNEMRETRELRVEDIQENLGEKKAEIQQTREQKREQWLEKRNQNIENYSERMLGRLETAIMRMEQIHERIQSRIQKLEHMDTAEASEYLEKVEGELKSLRTRLQESREDMSDMFDSETPKENLERVRTRSQETVSVLRGVHENMIKAVASMRAQIASEEVEEEGGVDE